MCASSELLMEEYIFTDYVQCSLYTMYTGWPKLKYPCSKFAISWQWHKLYDEIYNINFQAMKEYIHRVMVLYL